MKTKVLVIVLKNPINISEVAGQKGFEVRSGNPSVVSLDGKSWAPIDIISSPMLGSFEDQYIRKMVDDSREVPS